MDGNEVAGKTGTGYFWHKTGRKRGAGVFCQHGDKPSNAVK